MKQEETTLDFNKTGITLDDIDFGDVEVVDTPITTEEVKEEVSVEASEDVEVKEEVNLEDIDFEDTDEELVSDKPKRITKDIRIDAVKAILKKKLDRYEIDVDVNLDEMDEEQLAEFEEQLDEAVLSTKWDSFKSSSKTLDKLMSYIENGGDPSKIINLFQEQQEISKIDITTPEGQAKLIKNYYTEVLGWSPEKVENKVERLSASGLLQDEVQDVKEAYDNHYEELQAKKIKEQEAKAQKEQQILQQKRQMFEQTLSDLKLPKKLQDEYKAVAFGQGVLKGTDEKINILDYKILQMQSNPEMFLKLVQFVTDPQGYDNIVSQNKKNAEVVKETKKGFFTEKQQKQSDNVAVQQKNETKRKYNFQFN